MDQGGNGVRGWGAGREVKVKMVHGRGGGKDCGVGKEVKVKVG